MFIRLVGIVGVVPTLALAIFAGTTQTLPKDRTLTGAELKRLHGVYHAVWKNRHKAQVVVRRDGTLTARSGPRVDVGRWEVRGNELCVAFRVWTKGRYKCGTLERQGAWMVGLRKKDGTPRLKLRR